MRQEGKMKIQAMRRVLFGLFALAVIGMAPSSAQEQKLEKVKVALHWNAPAHQFLHYYAAIKNGYYKAQGLEVELLALPGSVPAVLSVNAGDTQVGQASSDAILLSLTSGATLKSIFLLYQQTPNGVIVLKNSGIKSFADLRGKAIATSVASPEGLMLTARLREAGIDPEKDVRLLNVAPAAKLTMQLTGQADASTGLFDFQYIQAQMQGKDVEFLPFSTEAAPLYGHAIFVNTNWLEKNQAVARRFVLATVQGLTWAHDNIDKAVDMVVTWDSGVKVDREFARRGWEVNLKDLIVNNRTKKQGVGHMEAAGWSNLVKILKDGGVLKSNVDLAKAFSNDYLPKDAPRW
jgi:NitT/TauT family transport system substrate-binding protein